MAKNLLEAYAKPVAIAENYYKSKHNGEAMDSTRKLVLVSTLRNVNKRLHEALEMAQATQKVDMAFGNGPGNQPGDGTIGSYARFTMNLVNAAVN